MAEIWSLAWEIPYAMGTAKKKKKKKKNYHVIQQAHSWIYIQGKKNKKQKNPLIWKDTCTPLFTIYNSQDMEIT